MRWPESQLAMLRAMGLRVWQPGSPPQPATGFELQPPAALAAEPAMTGSVIERPAAPSGERPAREGIDAATVRSRIDGMDWPALRAAVAGCTACALCQGRRNTVFGVGHEHARWMIVGEAPGEQEDLRGEPFVGAAGRLLDRMLAALGLTRSESDAEHQVFIANTLKCRPPHNRNPEPQELAQCLPFLERQVQLVQPKVILAMGRTAVTALLGSHDPIGRLRGRVHSWRGCPVVVTYHPAYLLRQPTEKARAWADLCLAAEVYGRQSAG